MAIKHPVLIALSTLSIICVGTASVSALYLPRSTATALALTKDNQKSPSNIFFLPKEHPQLGVGWEITTSSGDAELALAQHLVNIGAKEYVAWWCPHCHEQKLLFGKEAYQIISDSIKVECDKRGLNAHPDWCKAAKVTGFPTWVINGHQYSGVQNLKELAIYQNFLSW
ncbi:thioredoxin domain-containing protein [Nostoc sp.]